MKSSFQALGSLAKVQSGINGFDDITYGGLPQGRPTLVCGGAGSGKTLFAMEFLVRGATEFGEPGLFVSFEEGEEDLVNNFLSLGFDLEKLQSEKKILLDYVHIERSEIEETGEYNLEGLFVRLGFAIEAIGAKRVVLDTLEALFAGFSNHFVLRSEIRRLFRWLKDRGITAVITAERGDRQGALTRHGLEEYVSDCVVELDHRIKDQISTRYLRVLKYRGTTHGTNLYPFLIDEGGFSVLPITSVGLDYAVSSERISTGVPRLDTMLGDKGLYRGSSVLISGSAGTGKTSFVAHLADAACRRGERCLYYAFEESSSQIIRNMRSIGLDLQQWVDADLLRFRAVRPTYHGLEMHVAEIHKNIEKFKPSVVVLDPISNLISIAGEEEVKTALMRLVDIFKAKLITSAFTTLLHGATPVDDAVVGVSSLTDTWIFLRALESGGEHNRILHVIKSRGMSHSNQVREFLLTGNGMELVDVYIGPAGVLTGAARLVQEDLEKDETSQLEQEILRKKREIERKREIMEAEAALLHAQLESEQEELKKRIDELELQRKARLQSREQMARLRAADQEKRV
ncbi:circadian clock protein KaiC [Desulfonatronum parangueonense]